MTGRFLVRRLLAGIVQIVLITLVAWSLFFVLASATGAGPAERIAGKAATAEQVRAIAHRLGTDAPYPLQYARFLGRLARGDLGYSYVQRRPVADIVFPAAGATASLVGVGAFLWLLLAIPLGTIAALRPRSATDRLLMGASLVGMSVPSFWLAPLASFYLAFQPTQGSLLGIDLGGPHTFFPITGYDSLRDDPASWLHHLILPAAVLAAGFAAVYARFVRALTMEQLVEDYVRTATAKGASRVRVVGWHVGRNVAPVIVTLLGVDIGTALAGVLFVEQVYAIPGLGNVGLTSIQQLDYPLTLGVIVFAAVVAVVANAVVDIAQGLLDPRTIRELAAELRNVGQAVVEGDKSMAARHHAEAKSAGVGGSGRSTSL